MSEKIDDQLRECPFCGNKWNKPSIRTYYNKYVGRMYFVECGECMATSRHEPTEEYAIMVWNKRVEKS